MFCAGVQHHLWFCLDNLTCVKMVAFQFYLQSEKQGKVGWVGMTVMFLLFKNSLIKMEVWDSALLWWTSESFCCQSSEWGLRKVSHIRRKMSQLYEEFAVLPARMNSLWTIPLMSKKIMSMLLTLLFACVAFFIVIEFWFSMYGSSCLPWTLI
jgi:hypothetical protein